MWLNNNLVHFLQVDAEENEAKSFFFMSDDALTCDKLMILIHGSGVVRAGQWARRSLTITVKPSQAYPPRIH